MTTTEQQTEQGILRALNGRAGRSAANIAKALRVETDSLRNEMRALQRRGLIECVNRSLWRLTGDGHAHLARNP